MLKNKYNKIYRNFNKFGKGLKKKMFWKFNHKNFIKYYSIWRKLPASKKKWIVRDIIWQRILDYKPWIAPKKWRTLTSAQKYLHIQKVELRKKTLELDKRGLRPKYSRRLTSKEYHFRATKHILKKNLVLLARKVLFSRKIYKVSAIKPLMLHLGRYRPSKNKSQKKKNIASNFYLRKVFGDLKSEALQIQNNYGDQNLLIEPYKWYSDITRVYTNEFLTNGLIFVSPGRIYIKLNNKIKSFHNLRDSAIYIENEKMQTLPISGFEPYWHVNTTANWCFPSIGRLLNEKNILNLYSTFFKTGNLVAKKNLKFPRKLKKKKKKKLDLASEKRKYLKHIVLLRYRWVGNLKIKKTKLFRKFFKRTFKRFRRIGKNRLFNTKIRNYFSYLTGFSERALFKLWVPFRKSYNQYNNSIRNVFGKFSQTILLMPANLLVMLHISPSLSASKCMVSCGSLYINGISATQYRPLLPGDIMQINMSAWNKNKTFFNYQKLPVLNQKMLVSFIQSDWSAMMFMMVRWPRAYELISPTFLSEKWLRYYIRNFPVRRRKYKKAEGNWAVYKKLPKR